MVFNEKYEGKTSISGYYSAISHSYDELHGKEQFEKLKVIGKHVRPEKDDLILDVGCGTCFSRDFFNCNFKGVEPSKDMVLRHSKGKFLVGKDVFISGVEGLRGLFEENLFDYVICVTAAHHFMDVRRAFIDMRDLGKKGCVFGFSLLKGSGNYDECVSAINDFFVVIDEEDVQRDKVFICRKK